MKNISDGCKILTLIQNENASFKVILSNIVTINCLINSSEPFKKKIIQKIRMNQDSKNWPMNGLQPESLIS